MPWLLFTYFFALFVQLALNQNCTFSSECGANQCCRNPATNSVLSDEPSFIDFLPSATGQCVTGGAQPGEVCDFNCSCPPGYECYRRITGVCCVPSTCITVEEANADREYWRCRPPPVKRSVSAKPKSLFRYLCPELPPQAPESPQVTGSPLIVEP